MKKIAIFLLLGAMLFGIGWVGAGLLTPNPQFDICDRVEVPKNKKGVGIVLGTICNVRNECYYLISYDAEIDCDSSKITRAHIVLSPQDEVYFTITKEHEKLTKIRFWNDSMIFSTSLDLKVISSAEVTKEVQ